MGLLDIFKRSKREFNFDELTKAELAMVGRFPFDQKERKFIEMRIGVPLQRFSDFDSYLETGYKKVWATHRACRIISSVLVSAQFRLLRDGVVIDESERPRTGQRAEGWFMERPNPYDSWEEIIEMWCFHMILTGNCYWLKDEKDAKGRPQALYPLLPQYMSIVAHPTEKVSHYLYKINGKEIRFEQDDIIHFKRTHPSNLNYGLGDIEPAEDLFESFINANTLEEKFLANGAQVSGILSRDTSDGEDVDEDEWKALKARFNAEYAGKKNAGKTAFLNGKWSYTKLGLTMAEMQQLEKEKWTIEQIFINHGIPLSIAGIQGAANYATSRQDEINFRRMTCVPMLDILIGKLNTEEWFDVNKRGVQLAYELSGLIDVEQIVKDYGPLVDKGAMTPNELRELCGLPSLDDDPLLNAFYIDRSRVPIEMAALSDPNRDDIRSIADRSQLPRRRRSIDIEPEDDGASD
jgi:HK97 family phage portal protein